ncbi:hypothetical protein Tco_0716334 [Tanacetum coccineum]
MIPKTERLQKYKKLHVVSYGLDRGLESVRYGVSNVLDMAYWGFLGVGTTFDIFQNIHILYLQYGVLVFSGYGVLILFPLWSFGECRHRYAVSSLMDTAYWLSEHDLGGFGVNPLSMKYMFCKNEVEGLEKVALTVEFMARSGGDGMVVC